MEYDFNNLINKTNNELEKIENELLEEHHKLTQEKEDKVRKILGLQNMIKAFK